jgi:hypothetical protein
MEPLQTGTLVSAHYLHAEAHSALPHAPVVPHVERQPRAAAPRLLVAAALHRVADAVAPRPFGPPARQRRQAYAGGGAQ